MRVITEKKTADKRADEGTEVPIHTAVIDEEFDSWVSCPHCGHTYEQFSTLRKNKIRCKKCGRYYSAFVVNGTVMTKKLPDDPETSWEQVCRFNAEADALRDRAIAYAARLTGQKSSCG